MKTIRNFFNSCGMTYDSHVNNSLGMDIKKIEISSPKLTYEFHVGYGDFVIEIFIKDHDKLTTRFVTMIYDMRFNHVLVRLSNKFMKCKFDFDSNIDDVLNFISPIKSIKYLPESSISLGECKLPAVVKMFIELGE